METKRKSVAYVVKEFVQGEIVGLVFTLGNNIVQMDLKSSVTWYSVRNEFFFFSNFHVFNNDEGCVFQNKKIQ